MKLGPKNTMVPDPVGERAPVYFITQNGVGPATIHRGWRRKSAYKEKE